MIELLHREIEIHRRAIADLQRHIPHETGERRASLIFHRDWHTRILTDYLASAARA